jgi:DNA-binding MarR family transcriptional regulator
MPSQPTFTNADLVTRLERAMHAINKRVYAPSMRALRDAVHEASATSSADPAEGAPRTERLDKGSVLVLSVLDERGELRSSDLATIVDLDLSTVSRHVSYFEQLGLVTREPDPGDRRASRVSLTPKGRSGLTAIRAARAALLDSVFATWTRADRAEFNRLLERLQADLTDLSANAAGTPAGRVVGVNR